MNDSKLSIIDMGDMGTDAAPYVDFTTIDPGVQTSDRDWMDTAIADGYITNVGNFIVIRAHLDGSISHSIHTVIRHVSTLGTVLKAVDYMRVFEDDTTPEPTLITTWPPRPRRST